MLKRISVQRFVRLGRETLERHVRRNRLPDGGARSDRSQELRSRDFFRFAVRAMVVVVACDPELDLVQVGEGRIARAYATAHGARQRLEDDVVLHRQPVFLLDQSHQNAYHVNERPGPGHKRCRRTEGPTAERRSERACPSKSIAPGRSTHPSASER